MIALNLRPTLQLTDDLTFLQAKMQEYIDNGAHGAQLGWLIAPETRQVYCYQPQQAVEVLEHPSCLPGKPLLPHFVMDLTLIWD
ncbi:Uma2 family endonuclease [Thermosynechococcus sp. QKsg1]|uniref:Uma2 family endonuclease n=1 Tax=unclassified Thermosynechococcus TaxID=2622553 RepID=UPI002576611A|nr:MULTISPECIES: Uma2 family endonuclease [unclassified Thermosynechococcus]WJI23190.1 Uma2 family endonuclease [Thermosynechococcus sp. B0]WNC85808.1 Uma2 family endonuclease [Thermosynechococcus sp. QKsg1]